ncbi:hypothetical protein EYC84_012134 [Monilinia fructicola]|uniref:Uncharacterized protein n=1 Tax=Monilinia fructicola TaxID=38448 RepID=A0A5M9J617_MONFR|nr:hypothetical protein EYC84_012134 [Monilinia fructicola]
MINYSATFNKIYTSLAFQHQTKTSNQKHSRVYLYSFRFLLLHTTLADLPFLTTHRKPQLLFEIDIHPSIHPSIHFISILPLIK